MAKVCPKCDATYATDVDFCEVDHERLIIVKDDLLAEGQVIDERYRVLGILGKGGMGAVYRAYQLLMDREVALKILNTDTGDAAQVKRFFIEAKSASKLTHPNTITVFDFGQTSDGLLYMVIELVKGRTLSSIIKEGALPAERCVHIISQICDSISEAHSQGIIHRDLKPDNILIEDKDWNADFVKVLDFGIAKMLQGGDGTAVTKTGIVCGTPQYMSPEAITGQTVSPAADLYSLGIILYEMLSGSPPFQAETPIKLLMKHLSDEPTSLVSPDGEIEVPIQLDRFIMRVLSKKPELRPATAKQFKEELVASLAEFKKRPTTTTMRAMQSEKGVRSLVDDGSAERKPVPRPRTAVLEPTDAPAGASADETAAPAEEATASPGETATPSYSYSYDDIELASSGPKKGVMIAAMAFALVGLAILAFVILGSSRGPTRGAGGASTGTTTAPVTGSAVDAEATAARAEAGASPGATIEEPGEATPDASAAASLATEEIQEAGAPEGDVPTAQAPPKVPIKARLLSTPEGAAVFFSGVEICKTPCELEFVAAKREEKREYRVKLRGYQEATLPIILGMKDDWSVKLEKAVRKAPRKAPAKTTRPKKKTPVKPKPPKAKGPSIDIEPGQF